MAYLSSIARFSPPARRVLGYQDGRIPFAEHMGRDIRGARSSIIAVALWGTQRQLERCSKSWSRARLPARCNIKREHWQL